MPKAILQLITEFICEDFGKQQWDKKHILLLAQLSDLGQCGKESRQMS